MAVKFKLINTCRKICESVQTQHSMVHVVLMYILYKLPPLSVCCIKSCPLCFCVVQGVTSLACVLYRNLPPLPVCCTGIYLPCLSVVQGVASLVCVLYMELPPFSTLSCLPCLFVVGGLVSLVCVLYGIS